MIFTAAEYRTWAGLQPADPPPDADIERALATTLAFVESYLDRSLSSARHVERYYHVDTPELILRHYPVTAVHSVSVDGGRVDPATLLVHGSKGEIIEGPVAGRVVEIDYNAGWNSSDIPGDLMLVLMNLARDFLETGGNVTVAAGTIKRESVAGVATIEYFDPRDSGGEDKSSDFPGIGVYAAILEKYRGWGWVA